METKVNIVLQIKLLKHMHTKYWIKMDHKHVYTKCIDKLWLDQPHLT